MRQSASSTISSASSMVSRQQIGKFAALEIAPDLFDRIEVGGITRKPLDHQPSSLSLEEGLHVSAAVRRESVPNEGDLVAVEVTMEFGEELHDRLVVVGARLHAEDKGRLAAVGSKTHRGRHRQPLPVEVVGEDGRLTLGCPGRPHRREEAEPAFVLEDRSTRPWPGRFFYPGPAFVDPLLDGLIVALDRSPGRLVVGSTPSGGAPARHARGGT